MDWLVKPAPWYAEHGIERLLSTAIAVDASAREVRMAAAAPLAFDQVLIATGGRNRRLPTPGADLAGVLSLSRLTGRSARSISAGDRSQSNEIYSQFNWAERIRTSTSRSVKRAGCQEDLHPASFRRC